jgi:carbamoyl-phosphate synthase large subunit
LIGIDIGWSLSTQLLVDVGCAVAVACLAKDGYAIASGLDLGSAFATAMSAVGTPLPLRGRAFLTVTGRDRRQLALLARALADLGFELVADEDTALLLRRHGVPVIPVAEGDVADLIWHGNVHLIVDIGRPSPPLAASEQTPVVVSIRGLLVAIQGIQARNDFVVQHKKVERARSGCP